MEPTIRADIPPRVAEDLEKLQQAVVGNTPDVEAMILTGSFAHGEGAFLKSAGEPQPFNDYDVVVIAKTEPDANSLKSLGAKLAGSIGIRGVDLIGVGLNRFPWSPPSIFNFDLRHQGHVFYGEADILELLPDWKPGDIPLIEAQVLLLNRMMCLLECVKDVPKEESNGSDAALFLAYQTSKAVFAVADAVALLHGTYAIRYEKKRDLVSALAPAESESVQLVEAAWQLRQNLSVENLKLPPSEFWQRTRRELLRTFLHLMNWMYANHRPFESPQELGRFLANFNAAQDPRRACIEAAQYVTLAAWSHAAPDVELLALARELLARGAIGVEVNEWPVVRRAVVSGWFRYCH